MFNRLNIRFSTKAYNKLNLRSIHSSTNSSKTLPTFTRNEQIWMFTSALALTGGLFYMTSPTEEYLSKRNYIKLDGDPKQYIESKDILVETKDTEKKSNHAFDPELKLEDKEEQNSNKDSKTVLEELSDKEESNKVTEKESKVEPEQVKENIKLSEVQIEESQPQSQPQTSEPIESKDLTTTQRSPKVYYKYILVGGGTAAFSAMNAIRQREPDADILIISEEILPPYMRPPLSKELWFSEDPNTVQNLSFKDWQGNQRQLIYGKPENYQEVDKASLLTEDDNKVKLLLNTKVTKLNVERKVIHLDNDKRIAYGKLLLATGGSPRDLPNKSQLNDNIQSKISTYRGVIDFHKLYELCQSGKHIAIIGGGFLGSELAYALAFKNKQSGLESNSKVHQIFKEEGNMAKVFPNYLTAWTTQQMRQEGVNVMTNTEVTSFEPSPSEENKLRLTLNDNTSLDVDHVVVALGITPNDQLAREAKLEIDSSKGGILVNAELEARGDIFAAGDVASYHDIALGRRRVEHHDHAALAGRQAGFNMVGPKRAYTHQSMFWSDLGPKIGYEAVGLIDSQLDTRSVWIKPTNTTSDDKENNSTNQYDKGLVFYFNKEDRLVGVLLFNTFNKVDIARELIRLNKFDSNQVRELAAQFDLYSKEH